MKTRGFAVLELVIALVVLGLGAVGAVQVGKIFSPSKPTAQVNKLTADAKNAQVAAVAAQQSALIAQQALAADIAAHQAALAAEKKKEQDAAGFNAGVGLALAGETTPSINVQIAKTLQQQVAATLDPATADQLKQFQTVVAQLKATNDQQSKQLDQLKIERDQVKSQASQLVQQLAIADDTAKTAQAKNVALTASTQALTKTTSAQSSKLDQWANDYTSLAGRFKALIILAVVVLVIFPILSLAFPEFKPIAKLISVPFVGLWHWVAALEKRAMAALHADLTTTLASTTAALDQSTADHAATQATLVQVATGAVTVAPAPASTVTSPIPPTGVNLLRIYTT